MNPLYAAAADVDDVCAQAGWPYCFIGGLAVLRWGEPRLTRDVDVTIVTGFGGERPVVDALVGRFASRVDDPAAFAAVNRVLLLTAGNGIPIDVALGALPFEQRAAERASPYAVTPNRSLRVCSAEDLIVMKVFAGRDRDWADVGGVVTRQGEALDEGLIWEELTPLLEVKGDRDSVGRLRALLRGAGSP